MNPDITPEQLVAASRRAQVSGFLPYIEAELTVMRSAVENRVMTDLTSGKLTPEAAFAAWQEVAILKRLLHRLQSQTKMSNPT